MILAVLTFLHVIVHYDELGLVPNWPWCIIRGLFSYGLETLGYGCYLASIKREEFKHSDVIRLTCTYEI